jgi:hypothetical protein
VPNKDVIHRPNVRAAERLGFMELVIPI